MPTIYNLLASNNATFRWTRDFSQIAAAYDLATAVMRMQVRLTPYAPDPADYEWCSANTSGGVITYDATTHLVVISASESDMAALSALGDLVYDFRLEWTNGTDVTLFRGAFRWILGVTREPTGPIVPVNAQLLTLTEAVAAAQAAASSVSSILYVTAAPSATVAASYIFALDTLAGNFYVRLPSGSWQEISGGSSPVVPGALDLNPINPLTVAALN